MKKDVSDPVGVIVGTLLCVVCLIGSAVVPLFILTCAVMFVSLLF